jgi:hypothetical protein
MSGIYSLCPSPEAAQRAVDDLHAQGVRDEEITIISSQPFDEYPFGQRDRETTIQWAAVLGGTVGFIATVAVVSLVQLAWPLRTGGMPLIPILPNLIPIFEMTMLGAVLSTILALFVAAGLGKRLPKLYDPAVSEGKILIGVAQPRPDQQAALERALGANGELRRVKPD